MHLVGILSLALARALSLYTYVYAPVYVCLCTHCTYDIVSLLSMHRSVCSGVLFCCVSCYLCRGHPHQTRARTCSFLRVWGGIICTCVCVCLCLCTCVRVCSRVCVNDVMCVGVHIRMIPHTHTHTHTHKHTHTCPVCTFVALHPHSHLFACGHKGRGKG